MELTFRDPGPRGRFGRRDGWWRDRPLRLGFFAGALVMVAGLAVIWPIGPGPGPAFGIALVANLVWLGTAALIRARS